MCYAKIHGCKYCSENYPCNLPNVLCPTVNDDVDKNMCHKCRARLENALEQIEFESVVEIDLDELLGDDTK